MGEDDGRRGEGGVEWKTDDGGQMLDARYSMLYGRGGMQVSGDCG